MNIIEPLKNTIIGTGVVEENCAMRSLDVIDERLANARKIICPRK